MPASVLDPVNHRAPDPAVPAVPRTQAGTTGTTDFEQKKAPDQCITHRPGANFVLLRDLPFLAVPLVLVRPLPARGRQMELATVTPVRLLGERMRLAPLGSGAVCTRQPFSPQSSTGRPPCTVTHRIRSCLLFPFSCLDVLVIPAFSSFARHDGVLDVSETS